MFNKVKKYFENKKAKKPAQRKEIVALCLGGGGARGFAHIGAIKAFEEAKLDFDLCVGTSVGSLIGALYCAGVSASEMIEYANTINLKEVHNGILIKPNDCNKIGRLVSNFIGDADFKHLKKKFCAVAVDITEGKQVIIDRGRVADAVTASCCVPLFFKPFVRGREHLVDGGLLNNIPADICRMLGAEKVITVDINPTRGGGTQSLGLIDVLKATFSIMSANASITGLMNSDVVIAPDLSAYSATSKDGYEKMIELGYRETAAKIDDIKKLLTL